jgi:two-component system, NtrC family, response regulator AtoC
MREDIILVVDDDPSICFAFKQTFKSISKETLTASDGLEALTMLETILPSVIFMDISMPKMDGLQALSEIKNRQPYVPIIIITGEGNMQTTIRAMQLGAYDYLTKPLDIEVVRLTGMRAIEHSTMHKKIDALERQIESKKSQGITEIIGQNPKMQEIFKKIGMISTTPLSTNVLILGETGTGKELVARAIHENGPNSKDPFLAINCSALPENLLESEFFGHEKGAFTGANQLKKGICELAGNGTLLLDEIGDMTKSLQKKILRVIQERSFERLGGHTSLLLSARIVAATNTNLMAAIKSGEFRQDLYYRLNVLEIELPPLRERKEDLILLMQHFIQKYNRRMAKNIVQTSPDVYATLTQYDFPGNIRELENIVERAMALERSNILTLSSLPAELVCSGYSTDSTLSTTDEDFNQAKKNIVYAFEKKFIIEKLKTSRGNVSAAARLSRIERQSFQRLMKKYQIRSEDFRPAQVPLL